MNNTFTYIVVEKISLDNNNAGDGRRCGQQVDSENAPTRACLGVSDLCPGAWSKPEVHNDLAGLENVVFLINLQ